MAHDVLISYSSRDKLQADAICNRLESRGIRCWIAPRDVGVGEYAERIVEAIEEAHIMVLVYSANADQSHQVRREVERAVSKGVTIVPVRIEDHEMSKAFELYVGSMHWLDAITPPLEEHIDRLAEQLQALIDSKEKTQAPAAAEQPAAAAKPAAPAGAAPAAQPPVSPQPAAAAAPTAAAPAKGRLKLVIGAVAVVVVLLVLYVIFRPGSQEVSPGDASSLVAMTFDNTTAVPVLVYWVNDEGSEELYETLLPGQQWTADTHAGHVWVVRSHEGDGELEITECTAPPSDSDCIIDLVTGRDVAWVEFEAADGGEAGAYVETAPGAWVEEGPDGGARFEFTESGRDDWSVYLRDASRDVDIQIDLWTDRIMYSDATSPQRELYQIVDAYYEAP